MPVFPLAAITLTVVLDGRPIPSYLPATLDRGRVEAPVQPFVTRIAERVEYQAPYLIVTRGAQRVRILLFDHTPSDVMFARVPIASIARAFGYRAVYDSQRHVLALRSPVRTVQTPEPYYQSLAPQAAPTAIFTPVASPTPRPVWAGSPRPRRTPLQYSP